MLQRKRAPFLNTPWVDPAAVAALLAVNLAICWRLFKIEFTNNFSSIEGSFVALARYISRHWGQFSWWPLWHGGMPFQDTYVPLLHLTTGATATLLHLPPARAYHAVVGVMYALGPAAVYLMAVRLGARRGAALAGALLYSLISPSALLMPEIGVDIGGFWYPRRLQVLTVYGEGPHISAMTLLPLVILALEGALRRGTTRALVFAAIAMATVFLTNVPGTMALALAVFCWICAQPRDRHGRAWLLAGTTAVLAYGIACFGMPPSSLFTVGGNIGEMHHGFSNSLKHGPWPLLGVLGLVVAGGYLLARTPLSLITRFSLLFFALVAPLAITARVETYELLPQVGRLHLEMEMGACLLLGLVAYAVYSRVPKWVRPVILVGLLFPLVIQVQHYRERARSDLKRPDLEHRSEYTSARWIDQNLRGGRVYASGSTGFWFNAFTDSPQLIGCCEQGLAMPVLHQVSAKVNSGINPGETDEAITWLRALGVQAVLVNGPESTDEYKDFQQPQRFEGKLPVLYRQNGDTIYGLAPAGASLAHVVRPGETVAGLRRPQVESGEFARYAAALADPGRAVATFEWLDGGHARVRADLQAADRLSVQMAWFSGWKASVQQVGKLKHAAQVHGDGLGFIVVEPGCTGPCEVLLTWAGPPDLWPSLAVSLAFAGLFAVMVVKSRALPFPLAAPCDNEFE